MSIEASEQIDVVVRIDAERLADGSWKFCIYDRDGKLVSDGWRHAGPDFAAGRFYEQLLERWRSM